MDAGKITGGTLNPARLGTGTATASTVLFGEGTWKVPSNSSGGTAPDSLGATYGNGLPTAVSTIGAARKTLLIDADTPLTPAVTIPATLILQPKNGAKIISDGGSIIRAARRLRESR